MSTTRARVPRVCSRLHAMANRVRYLVSLTIGMKYSYCFATFNGTNPQGEVRVEPRQGRYPSKY